MPYAGDPNSAHQLWSFWIFEVYEAGRRVSRKDVEYNVAKWLKTGFGSAGRMRLKYTATGWRIECLIEGPPAHDPGYVASVRRQFDERFVKQGWGSLAWGKVTVQVMAGSLQDGKPPAQMIEMPLLDWRT